MELGTTEVTARRDRLESLLSVVDMVEDLVKRGRRESWLSKEDARGHREDIVELLGCGSWIDFGLLVSLVVKSRVPMGWVWCSVIGNVFVCLGAWADG